MKTNLEMQAQITKLTQLCDANNNLEQLLQEKSQYIEEQNKLKDGLHSELEKACNQLLEQEEKIKQAN